MQESVGFSLQRLCEREHTLSSSLGSLAACPLLPLIWMLFPLSPVVDRWLCISLNHCKRKDSNSFAMSTSLMTGRHGLSISSGITMSSACNDQNKKPNKLVGSGKMPHHTTWKSLPIFQCHYWVGDHIKLWPNYATLWEQVAFYTLLCSTQLHFAATRNALDVFFLQSCGLKTKVFVSKLKSWSWDQLARLKFNTFWTNSLNSFSQQSPSIVRLTRDQIM